MVTIGTPKSATATKVLLCGSGELGKEFVIELQRYGVEVIALDKYADAPAMQVAHRSYVVSMLDGDALREIVEKEKPDYIVPEVEAIATQTLMELEKEGFDKACVDKYLAMFEEITNDVQGVRYVKEKLEGVLEPEYADGLELIMNSVDAVKAADFKIAFDPTLVRGMSYYTGPIFEISIDEFGGSVGGGGRYDEMIGKFTGNNTCACGFSIGFERIIMLLMERGFQIPQIGTKKALLIEKNMPAEGMMKVLKQAEEDRKNGSVVTIAVMKKNKKFQKEQLKEEGYEEIVEFFADRM